MAEQSSKTRVRVRIGSHEFEAEGDQSTVHAQYSAFLAAIGPQSVASPIRPETIDRVFERQPTGLIRLKEYAATDDSEADGLILLLWAFRHFTGNPDVGTVILRQSAHLSGIPLERIDRAIASRPGLYKREGVKKGATYSLSVAGVRHAEDMLDQLFQ